jgi:hypothetical protein
MATSDPRPEPLTNGWPTHPGNVPRIMPMPQPDAPMPAWGVMALTEQATWAGRWAGSADALSWLLRRYEDDPDVAHALAEYRKLKARYEKPRVVVPSAEEHS